MTHFLFLKGLRQNVNLASKSHVYACVYLQESHKMMDDEAELEALFRKQVREFKNGQVRARNNMVNAHFKYGIIVSSYICNVSMT